jgi:hypothetical protein
MKMIRALAFGGAAILSVAGCGEEGVMSSTPFPSCGTGASPTTGTGAGGAKVTPSGSGGVVMGTAGTTATMGGTTGMVGTTGTGGMTSVGGSTDTGGTTSVGGSTDMGGTTSVGGSTDMGGTTGMAGTMGTGGADDGPPGPCPTGYNCVDLASLGAMAVDGSGMPVTASCGMGAPSANCNDANPASTCPGFTKPLCAHVSVAGMQIVSCGQRCTP